MISTNTQWFQDIAAALLQRHYGLTLGDTHLDEDSIVDECIRQGMRPFEVVAEHASEAGLERIDREALFGVPATFPLTVADELAVVQQLPPAIAAVAVAQFDYLTASAMYASCVRQGNPGPQQRDETLASFRPSRRSEYLFLKMLELGRTDLTDEERAFVLNDRFGDQIIGHRHAEYDGLEIHGVRDFNLPGDPQGSCCEVDDDTPQFFSVYVHLIEGGVECVGDFATHALASEYAGELAGRYRWPVRDFVSKYAKTLH